MSSADVQVVYTPPLYSAPKPTRPYSRDPLPILVAGHSLEANFSNSFTVFIGKDQVDNMRLCNVALLHFLLRTFALSTFSCPLL